MHSALWLLLKLDFQGSWRGFKTITRSWKRLGLFLLILLLVGLMVVARGLQSHDLATNRFGSGMPFWAFFYLAVSWLTASADRGLVMRPAEIHFLFGGPFKHRDIISLHLIRLVIRSGLSALILSLVAVVYLPSFLCGVVGLWLLLIASLLVGMIVGLMARSAHGRTMLRLRRFGTVTVIALLLIQVAEAVRLIQAEHLPMQISNIAAMAPLTSVGKVVLPPLEWMFRPLSATELIPTCISLLPARFGIVAVLIAAVYLLGSEFGEASVNKTDSAVARRQSALRSGSAAGTSSLSRRWAVPIPRLRLGGITAVGWWQTQNLIRILPRYLAFTVVVMGMLIVLPAMVDSQSMSGLNGVLWLVGLSLYGDFLLLLQLPVGFLGPIGQREMLKTLPIPNWRIVIGQLIGPLVPTLVIHSLTLGIFGVLFSLPRNYLICTAIALLPAALVIVSNLNLLGIWGFIQPRALQQRDVLAAGRAMASVWLFTLMLIPAVAAAAVVGVIFESLFGSWLAPFQAMILGCGIGCLIASAVYIAIIAAVFKRWQPAASDRGDDEKEHDA